MTSMKEEVEKFKKENSNENFTVKEMIMYNVTQIKEMNDKLQTHLESSAATKAEVKILKRLTFFCLTAIAGLVGANIFQML